MAELICKNCVNYQPYNEGDPCYIWSKDEMPSGPPDDNECSAFYQAEPDDEAFILRYELADLMADARALTAVLRRLEWSATATTPSGESLEAGCPVCRRTVGEGHAPDCALARALTRAKAHGWAGLEAQPDRACEIDLSDYEQGRRALLGS